MSDMAQLLRAKEVHSFVAHSVIIYDYAYDTESDHLFVDHFRNLIFHYLLNIN
jgi:hypothetical protein